LDYWFLGSASHGIQLRRGGAFDERRPKRKAKGLPHGERPSRINKALVNVTNLTLHFLRHYYPSENTTTLLVSILSMTIYDITVPLTNEMPTYPGDPGVQITDFYALAQGDPANLTRLNIGAHTGTHVDAPAHFMQGASPVESMPLDVLIGAAQVIHLPDDRMSIDKEFVESHVESGTTRVLFKTRTSSFWNDQSLGFRQDFTYLELAAAEFLVAQGVKLVGIDYLSIEQFGQKDHPTHLALLAKGVVIVEGLNLSAVPAGRYELICLPMRIRSGLGDGAPARVVLRS
jgi:arylformamidase